MLGRVLQEPWYVVFEGGPGGRMRQRNTHAKLGCVGRRGATTDDCKAVLCDWRLLEEQTGGAGNQGPLLKESFHSDLLMRQIIDMKQNLLN